MFCSPNIGEKPMVYEVFTDTHDESAALKRIIGLRSTLKGKLRNLAMEMVGGKGIVFVKKITGQY